MESGMVLGVARPEDSPDRHDAEPRAGLGRSQMQVDGPVVLNQSAELESSGSMAIDDAPAQQPSSQQVAAAQQSPATLTDTIVEVQKQLKRKRASNGPAIATADKGALVAGCRQELEGLFQYYKEVSGRKMQFEGRNLSGNAMVGCLLEESSLGLTKLVEEIHEKLKGTEGVSVASVRSSVLLIGQRMMYGKSSPDADVLEDESESALWCWEIRDLKLMPVKTRGILSTRRTARKKIHERIAAIYSTLSVLENPGVEAQVNDLRKASLKLNKSLNLEGIRSMVERATQKNNIERGVKDARSTGKELIQGTEKNDQNICRLEDVSVSELRMGNLPANEKKIQKVQKQAEKEIKRQEKEEAQMRKLQKKQQEEALREQKRLEKEEAEAKKQQRRQDEEAQKEQKRREKEEAEMKKQQKKEQEEAEKEQKRREKEAAQLKKQLAIQKQASMMERFFKSKDNGKLQKSGENDSGDTLCTDNKEPIPATTSKIDSSLSQQENWVLEDLWRLQVTGWKKLSNCNRSSRWGIRHKPKMEAFKELKLQKSSDDMVDEILSTPNEDNSHNLSKENEHDKLESDIDMLPASEMQRHGINNDKPLQTRLIRRKLLQFDKSNRPAYYGTWRKKSAVVGPRCPLKMDPDLDYEVDSDDEWEEEDPGESLSDCEKDSDEVMEEDSKITDEDDEDSFVVPDGYLSDNEGIQIESLLDDKDEEASSSPTVQCTEAEEFRFLLRQQKVFNTLTEQALRKSQPLVISNINHEKAELLTAGDLKGVAKIEQLCLQVLSMRICPGSAAVDVPVIDSSSTNHERINQSNVKISSPAAAAAITEMDLPEIVQVIRSCRDGINKLVELLHQKFPNVLKSQLKSKAREISDFVDNHWKVKKEVLDKLGLDSSPVKSKKTKGIATYFSKRCLPPEEAINALASSPELRLKSKTIQNGNGGTKGPQINLFSSPQ
ncbi:chromatin assembly factor 1 subunit FSM-like [Phragmites australis]|uniref:chromatin assembly factor 1 subunit FSM-like n=1 Tax=Phragmites australis TaxID=29695 RepID=UPI002D76B54F|nr:chromatin assembly factor 1 subunit FSM-like [Phragmites australis]